MSAIRDRRASTVLPALTIVLALTWLVGIAAPTPANGPLVHAATASANGGAALVRQQRPVGGLVANRDKAGCDGHVLLGPHTGARGTALIAEAFGPPVAVRPGRWIWPALVDARAPPLLQLA